MPEFGASGDLARSVTDADDVDDGKRQPRRLLYVVNEFYFFYSHRLSLALKARDAGWEIHVAAPSTAGWAPDGFDPDCLTKENITLHDIPLSRRGRSPFHDARTVFALMRLYSALRPRMIHHLTIKPIVYGGIAARILSVGAVVHSITGLGQIFVERGPRAAVFRRIVGLLYRLALKHPCCAVIVQNPDDRDQLVAMRATTSEKTSLIRGSGVDLDTFRAQSEPPGRPLVILPARLIWEKGVGDFVAAARLLRERGVDAQFALLGQTIEENPRAVPESVLRRWTEEGIVEWWGFASDMMATYARCHVVCLPSFYGEGVPKALIEAAACGRALVATDTPGCRDIVRDGVNGLTVAPGDIVGLADSLQRLIEDPALRRRFAAAGPGIVRDEFSLGTVIDQTMAVYDSLHLRSSADRRPSPSR